MQMLIYYLIKSNYDSANSTTNISTSGAIITIILQKADNEIINYVSSIENNCIST